MNDREQSDDDESFAPGAAGPSRPRAPPHGEGLPTLHLRPAVLREIITSGFAEPAKAKVTPNALTLSSALIRAFVAEAAHRSAREAESCGADEVQPEHLERILPQLLLDFGP